MGIGEPETPWISKLSNAMSSPPEFNAIEILKSNKEPVPDIDLVKFNREADRSNPSLFPSKSVSSPNSVLKLDPSFSNASKLIQPPLSIWYSIKT